MIFLQKNLFSKTKKRKNLEMIKNILYILNIWTDGGKINMKKADIPRTKML